MQYEMPFIFHCQYLKVRSVLLHDQHPFHLLFAWISLWRPLAFCMPCLIRLSLMSSLVAQWTLHLLQITLTIFKKAG